jgi:hypothetical protein
VRQPWRIDGPERGPERPALADALRRLHEARHRSVPDDYSAPVSTLPMTRAAREALRLYYGGVPPSRRFAQVQR